MKGNNSQIIIYQAENGETKLDVSFDTETVWLTQKQMATLFGKSVSRLMSILKIYLEKHSKKPMF